MTAIWRRIESGFTIGIQAVYYTFLLFVFFALIYDVGNAGFAYTVVSNAARLAAQDAAKNLDEEAFIDSQEIRLREDATERAQEIVTGITQGGATVTLVGINSMNTRDVIIVRARAQARMPILATLFNLSDVTFTVDGYAEPAYGISEEGQ